MSAKEEFEKLFLPDSLNAKMLKQAFNITFHECFIGNITKDEFDSDIFYSDGKELKIFESFQALKKPFTFSEFHNWCADNLVITNTEEYREKNDIKNIIRRFEKGENSYSLQFKTQLFNGKISLVSQNTFLIKDDKSGDIFCFTTISLLSDTMHVERFSLYSKTLIQTLSADFEAAFFVDLKNDSIFTLRASQDFLKRNQKIENIVIYSLFCKYITENSVYKDDYSSTLVALSKKNIFREFNQKDLFTINYRILNSQGNFTYYQFKLVKTNEWDTNNSFILGIHNIDEETLKNFEQLEKIKKQTELNLQLNAVINTISKDFTSIFYMEFDHDRVFEYRTSELFKQLQPASTDLYISIPHFANIMRQICLSKVSPDYREKLLKMLSPTELRALINDVPIFYHDFKLNLPSGEKFFQLKIVRDFTKKDEFNIVVGFVDIDKQRRMEIYQQQALEEARLKAELANKAKSTFLFNMSHDIRTPMNAIIGYSAMTERYINDPKKALECLEKVRISGDHLLKLIDDILDMARIENGKIKIDENPLHIRSCIEKIVEMEKVDVEAARLSLDVKFNNLKTDIVIADSFRLNQIFLNIIGNSIKYTMPGGKITLTVTEFVSDNPDYASLEFSVEDTGIGMKPEFLSHIFEMFSRERNTTASKVQGTGLGMAIVKNLVDLMNGKVFIESEFGKGTKVTFNFNFKIQKAPFSKDKNSAKKQKRISLKGKRALLVEDNELNREIAKDILEIEHIIVDQATNGSEAVDIIKNSKPGFYDFVLMDVQMPIIDGYQATDMIRKLDNKKLANVPIIAMTANAFEEDKKRALDSGMDDYLSKPIRAESLFNTVTRILGKK
jgi:signal transduction histidine kinase/CheY-like chemotaxis protein